jgi:hypothetical protein
VDDILNPLATEIEFPSDMGWAHRLRHVRALAAALEEWELAILMAARAGVAPASWAEIGDVLGMTRQSAWQRLATDVDRPDDPRHRLLKARLGALIAGYDAALAEQELDGVDAAEIEDSKDIRGFAKQFRALVNQHAKECRLDELEDVL